MKIFIDSIDLDDITKFVEIGLVDGVTTNPSSVSKGSLSYKMILRGICEIVSGPVSAEVLSEDFDSMMIEAEQLLEVAQNLVIKLPATYSGLKAAKQLSEKKQKTNITLCFTAHQALLAAKVGATYVSPFVGRLEDQAEDGIGLLADIMSIYREYDIPTRVIAASVRNPFHVLEAARRGVDVVTLPPKVLEAMLHHELTISGLKKFAEDWHKSGKGSI